MKRHSLSMCLLLNRAMKLRRSRMAKMPQTNVKLSLLTICCFERYFKVSKTLHPQTIGLYIASLSFARTCGFNHSRRWNLPYIMVCMYISACFNKNPASKRNPFFYFLVAVETILSAPHNQAAPASCRLFRKARLSGMWWNDTSAKTDLYRAFVSVAMATAAIILCPRADLIL